MKESLKIRNPADAEKLAEDGFFKTAFISAEKVQALSDLFYRFFNENDLPPVFDSMNGIPGEKRAQLYNAILDICNIELNSIMTNFKVVIAMYYVKKSGEDTEVGLHIDPSMTTENYNHIGIWIPLTDVNETTGKMCFLKGSHTYIIPYHGLSIPAPFSNITKLVLPEMTCVELQKGDALFFTNNTVHYTQKNISGNIRLSVIIKVIDEKAPLVSAYIDSEENNSTIELYEHKDDYYISNEWQEKSKPANAKYLGKTVYKPILFDTIDFLNLLKKLKRAADN